MTEVFQVLRSPMTCKFSLLALQQQNTVQPGSPVVGAGTEHWKILTTSQVAQLRSAAASSKLHSEISQKAKPSVEGFWSHVFRSAFGGLHRELAWIWICVGADRCPGVKLDHRNDAATSSCNFRPFQMMLRMQVRMLRRNELVQDILVALLLGAMGGQ